VLLQCPDALKLYTSLWGHVILPSSRQG